MARVIPGSIPDKASRGEILLYQVLRDRLPNSYIIWYEPIVKGLHPDFVILGPDFELLVIEVKGWSAGQIEEANNSFFRIRRPRRDTPILKASDRRNGQGIH